MSGNMFLRFLHLGINPEYLPLLAPFHDRVVIPELQKIKGCLFAALIQSNQESDKCVSLTLWDSRELAEAYEKSEGFRVLMKQVRPYLSDSAEWKINLSQDLELQYEPAGNDLSLREFRVIASQAVDAENLTGGESLHVRLVSMKLREGKSEEFHRKYTNEIVPALQLTHGCRYIYLTENLHNKNEVISLTIWDSKKDADAYEKSGEFAALVDRVNDLLSHFYQWKIALEKEGEGKMGTSEDMKVNDYALVSGKRFT